MSLHLTWLWRYHAVERVYLPLRDRWSSSCLQLSFAYRNLASENKTQLSLGTVLSLQLSQHLKQDSNNTSRWWDNRFLFLPFNYRNNWLFSMWIVVLQSWNSFLGLSPSLHNRKMQYLRLTESEGEWLHKKPQLYQSEGRKVGRKVFLSHSRWVCKDLLGSKQSVA